MTPLRNRCVINEADLERVLREGDWNANRARKVVELLTLSEENCHARSPRNISLVYDYLPLWAAAVVILEMMDCSEKTGKVENT